MRKWYTVLLLLVSLVAQSQEIEPVELEPEERKKMEFGGVFKSAINLEIGGKTGFAGISYDLFLSSHFRAGVGVGFPAAGIEAKWYPFAIKRDQLLLNFGARATAVTPPSATDYMFYSVPVGLSYFAPNRLNLEIDAGPLIKRNLGDQMAPASIFDDIQYVWISVKVGYRFSFYAIKRARRLNNAQDH